MPPCEKINENFFGKILDNYPKMCYNKYRKKEKEVIVMKNNFTLFTTFIDAVTGKQIQQVLVEKAEAIYNRVQAIKNNKNFISVEVFDNNHNLVFSK